MSWMEAWYECFQASAGGQVVKKTFAFIKLELPLLPQMGIHV